MRILSLVVLFILLLSNAYAQIVPDNWRPVELDFNLYEPPYLHTASIEDSLATERMFPFMAVVMWSFTGDYFRGVVEMDSLGSRALPQENTDSLLAIYDFVPARPRILAAADTARVLIINEGHHIPLHRIFTQSLLVDLYARGYRHFGLETLANSPQMDSTLAANGYMNYMGGYYTRDPHFAELVNTALDLGFSLFSYEHPSQGKGPAVREAGQAHNVAEYMRANPEGKVLLHVGYSHAAEGYLGERWVKAMAGRLADTLGINPLTVDQTNYRERSAPAFERALIKVMDSEEASVLIDSAGNNYRPDPSRGMDFYVVHPRTDTIAGRPAYAFSFGRKPLTISLENVDIVGPLMVHVYQREADINNAVPTDVIEAKGSSVIVAARPGKMRILVYNPQGEARMAEVK